MNALEREIIEKFNQLDEAAQDRVRAVIVSDTAVKFTAIKQEMFDADAWWAEVEVLQAEIRARIGNGGTIGALSLLDELREESS